MEHLLKVPSLNNSLSLQFGCVFTSVIWDKLTSTWINTENMTMSCQLKNSFEITYTASNMKVFPLRLKIEIIVCRCQGY